MFGTPCRSLNSTGCRSCSLGFPLPPDKLKVRVTGTCTEVVSRLHAVTPGSGFDMSQFSSQAVRQNQGIRQMRTIAVMNQKGGVGKTTSSVNLAAALAREGRRVCLIDLDPQGHASFHVGVEAGSDMPTIYNVFTQETTIDHTRQLVGENLSLVPANIDLAATEVELAGTQGREFFLRNAIRHWRDQNRFDYIVMDCPPSLGILTINALTAVNEVFIPLQPHFFALQGLSKLFETTALVTRRLNRELRVTGIMLCLYESGTRLAADVTEDLKQFLLSSDQDTPWAAARIFRTKVRRNIKLAEAPSFGQSIIDYAPTCSGAADYMALGQEVLQMENEGMGSGDHPALAADRAA